MIQRDYVTEWREHAPWVTDAQVEQDLVICRALIEIFQDANRSISSEPARSCRLDTGSRMAQTGS